MLQEYDAYIQNLLVAQYDASEHIQNKLVRGEVREDFLRNEIIGRLPQYRAVNGIIVDIDGTQSPQCDCILLDRNSQTRRIGRQEIVGIEDVLYVIEIKSNVTGADLRKFNEDIQKIKNMRGLNDGAQFILFAYRISLKFQSVLTRFSHTISMIDRWNYIIEFLGRNSKEEYPNIDILVSLDSRANTSTEPYRSHTQFILQRFEKKKGMFQYYFNDDEPIIGQFFGILK